MERHCKCTMYCCVRLQRLSDICLSNDIAIVATTSTRQSGRLGVVWASKTDNVVYDEARTIVVIFRKNRGKKPIRKQYKHFCLEPCRGTFACTGGPPMVFAQLLTEGVKTVFLHTAGKARIALSMMQPLCHFLKSIHFVPQPFVHKP